MKCVCRSDMKLMTVRKEGKNRGRRFWSCENDCGKGFKWADEPKPEVKESPKTDNEVWEAKDRQSLAQTAINNACIVSAARITALKENISDDKIMELAKKFYARLLNARNGKKVTKEKKEIKQVVKKSEEEIINEIEGNQTEEIRDPLEKDIEEIGL